MLHKVLCHQAGGSPRSKVGFSLSRHLGSLQLIKILPHSYFHRAHLENQLIKHQTSRGMLGSPVVVMARVSLKGSTEKKPKKPECTEGSLPDAGRKWLELLG